MMLKYDSGIEVTQTGFQQLVYKLVNGRINEGRIRANGRDK